MGEKIGMQIKIGIDGKLEYFAVPNGSAITYAELARQNPKARFDSSIAAKVDSIVKLVYEKLEKQPVPYGALLTLCHRCECRNHFDYNDIKVRLAERAMKNGDRLNLVDSPAHDGSYLVLESRVQKTRV